VWIASSCRPVFAEWTEICNFDESSRPRRAETNRYGRVAFHCSATCSVTITQSCASIVGTTVLKALVFLFGVTFVVVLAFVIDREAPSGSLAPVPIIEPAQIHASGRVEGAARDTELRAEIGARVVEIRVRQGDHVRAGAPLIKLDGSSQRHRFLLAKAELAAAEAELERLTNGKHPLERREAAARASTFEAQLDGALRRLARASSLRDKGAASQQQFDDLTAEVRALEAQLDSARAWRELLDAPPRDDELRLARAKVAAAQARMEVASNEWEKTMILAQADVLVLAIGVEVGELTSPDAAEPAVVVADTSKIHVRAFVEERDAPQVVVGMSCRISADGLPGRTFRGRVVRLAPGMSQKAFRTDDPAERIDTRVRAVWIEVEQPEGLLIGLCVDVVLDARQRGPALIHSGAVERRSPVGPP
jgi:multidrug resistance efflux pump